jgi:hypothetical protein
LKSPRFGERLLTNPTTNLHCQLLSTRHDRPGGCRAAEQHDELATLVCAGDKRRARRTSMPSALAVLRLMTNSNFGRHLHRQIGQVDY